MDITLNPIENRGKFLVIYGSNNLGKSTQVRRLVGKLLSEKQQVLCIKYPMYRLEPTGPIINNVLRAPEKLDRKYTEVEFQQLCAQNRMDFQSTLIETLNAGVNVIAEDYLGTGIAWGMLRGVTVAQMEEINSGLLNPDRAVLVDGERFLTAIEKNHRNEDAADISWQKSREIHLELGERYGWEKVSANGEVEAIHKNIWAKFSSLF